MSARDYYQPHVWINGRRLSESRDILGQTPIADIAIKWGTRDWFSDVNPSTAALVILDPLGELLALEKGAEILITADPDGRVMFRGQIETSRATYTQRQNRAGNKIPVWEVEIAATDPMLALAADRRHGNNYPPRNGQVNMLHWGRSLIIERFGDIQDRTRTSIVFRYLPWMELLDTTLGPQGDYAVLPYTLQQNVSVLTVLRRTARIENPLNRPFYDHRTNQIRLLKPPTADTLPTRNAALSVSGGKIVLNRAVSSVAATELEAARLIAGGGNVSLDLKEFDNVNRCLLKSSYPLVRPADTAAGIYGTHYEIRELSSPVSLSAGLGDGSTLELETDMIFTANPNIPASVYAGVETLMRATDQWRQIPPFSFRVRPNMPLPTALEKLFRAAPSYDDNTDIITPLTIVGSPLQWGGSAPSFSVVGGELRYTDRHGWEVKCTPALVPTRPVTGTKLEDFALSAPISAFADRYALGDLQLL